MAVREFRLPDLGEGLEDAEVVTWRVAEGDRVELNQTLVEVNTAKALVEIPAPWEGVVERLHAGEGEVVKVGEPLISMRVEDASDDGAMTGDARPEEVASRAQQAAQEVGEAAAGKTAEDAEASDEADRPKRKAVLVGYGVDEEAEAAAAARRRQGKARPDAGDGGGPVPASPPVRKLAKELGVELSSVRGTGPKGRVTREDVEAAAGSGPAGGEEGADIGAQPTTPGVEGRETESIPVRGARRLIAAQMSRSVREIPHVTTFLTVDASSIQAFRGELAGSEGDRIGPLPIILRALVEICAEHPKLNATFDAERSTIELYRDRHVGIATDTDRGLLVPVVRHADRLGITDLGREITRLADAARSGKVKPEEMSGGTITVSNVGTFGAEFGTPIINYPQAAILAVGVMEPRALVVEGVVEARPAMTLSLSFDHRLMDGAEAGRALRALGDLLESPFRLGSLPR